MDNTEVVLNEVFRYKIGDLVMDRGVYEALKADLKINGPVDKQDYKYSRTGIHRPEPIIERQLQQCHGGIQKFYMVRRVVNEKSNLMTMTEDELVSFDNYVDLVSSFK